MRNILLLPIMLTALLAIGCRSQPREKPSIVRGWIGGEFDTAARHLVPKGQQSRIYVKQIYPETPAEQAGIKPGDLILGIDEHSFKKLPDLRECLEVVPPGNPSTIHIWRDGQKLDLPLTVGRETYKNWHSFSIGGHFANDLDLWPSPDFSIFGLIQYRKPTDRLELRSAWGTLERQAGQAGPNGTISEEGWNTWFLILGFSGYKQICSQEPAAVLPHSDAGK